MRNGALIVEKRNTLFDKTNVRDDSRRILNCLEPYSLHGHDRRDGKNIKASTTTLTTNENHLRLLVCSPELYTRLPLY